jgi:hypothetical protein
VILACQDDEADGSEQVEDAVQGAADAQMQQHSVEGHAPQHRTHEYGAGRDQVEAQAESEAQNQERACNYGRDWSVLHELEHRPVVPHNQRELRVHVGVLQLNSSRTSAPVGPRLFGQRIAVNTLETHTVTVRKVDSMLSWGMDAKLAVFCDVIPFILVKSAKAVMNVVKKR